MVKAVRAAFYQKKRIVRDFNEVLRAEHLRAKHVAMATAARIAFILKLLIVGILFAFVATGRSVCRETSFPGAGRPALDTNTVVTSNFEGVAHLVYLTVYLALTVYPAPRLRTRLQRTGNDPVGARAVVTVIFEGFTIVVGLAVEVA